MAEKRKRVRQPTSTKTMAGPGRFSGNSCGGNGMEVRDYSITSDKENNAESPEYIKTAIPGSADRRVQHDGGLHHAGDEGQRLGELGDRVPPTRKARTIVGVWERGSKGCEVPEALDLYKDAVVGWKQRQKSSTRLTEKYRGTTGPDGRPRCWSPSRLRGIRAGESVGTEPFSRTSYGTTADSHRTRSTDTARSPLASLGSASGTSVGRLGGRNGKCGCGGPPRRVPSLCHEGNGGALDPLLLARPTVRGQEAGHVPQLGLGVG